MTEKMKIDDLPTFDIANYLTTKEDIAAYLTIIIEEGDASELAYALGVASRDRGMAEVAKSAGITREAMYKALRPGAHPAVRDNQ